VQERIWEPEPHKKSDELHDSDEASASAVVADELGTSGAVADVVEARSPVVDETPAAVAEDSEAYAVIAADETSGDETSVGVAEEAYVAVADVVEA
jgi:hypothetical protein